MRSARSRVAGLHVGGEPVRRFVGDRDGLGFILERDDGQDRAEDFLLRDAHVVGNIGKDRGFHEPAGFVSCGLSETAGQQAGALVDAHLDHLLDAIVLYFVEQGADVIALLRGIADGGRVRSALGDLKHLVVA